MTVLHKAIYRFSTIPIKLPMAFFIELEPKFLQVVWKHRPRIVKALLRKKNEAGEIRFPDLRYWVGQKVCYIRCYGKTWMNFLVNSLQSYSTLDGMALAQRQKHRSMEQAREPRDELIHLWSPSLWQRRQECAMEKRWSFLFSMDKRQSFQKESLFPALGKLDSYM